MAAAMLLISRSAGVLPNHSRHKNSGGSQARKVGCYKRRLIRKSRFGRAGCLTTTVNRLLHQIHQDVIRAQRSALLADARKVVIRAILQSDVETLEVLTIPAHR